MIKDPSIINVIYVILFQVSTYGLPVDDVLEVTCDTVVVHEDAASRVQRLSKVCILSSTAYCGFDL